MEEFEPIDKLEDICRLLDDLGCKYKVHRHDDGEFSYLDDSEVSVKIPNPYDDRTMYIDLQGEISLYFGEEWHAHYYADEHDYQEFIATLRGILTNELCSVADFLGEEREWGGSTLAEKSDIESKPPEEAYAGNRIMAQVYKEKWEKSGAEVRFLFWDPKYNKIITVEKR